MNFSSICKHLWSIFQADLITSYFRCPLYSTGTCMTIQILFFPLEDPDLNFEGMCAACTCEQFKILEEIWSEIGRLHLDLHGPW